MICSHRCFVLLTALASLLVGTTVSSQIGLLPKSAQISADGLFEKAQRADTRRSSRNSAYTRDLDPQAVDGAKSKRRYFTVYRNEAGDVECREATPAEIRERESADLEKLGLRQINHFELDKATSAQAPEATNLSIILRATQQLQQNATATAAFNRAAQNWENVIMSPVTIFIDVDFGTTNFGQTWPSGVLGATGEPSSSYPYQSVRANLISEATGEGNATKQAIFSALPSTTVPTDLGDASAVDLSDSMARAIGLLPATAQSTDSAARIAFNSNFTFDFDPSDGITAGQIDFDAVATHEIGHALGFDSDAGLNIPKPSVWDLYRFRTGTTTDTFPTASRVLTIGGSPNPLQYDFIPGNTELGLSNGGPAGSTSNGGDGWQSSHWKHVSACGGPIGIMDPAIPNGCRRTISNNDVLALTSFGYNLTNNNPPPPPPPKPTPPANDNFVNAQVINGCSGTIGGSTFGATSESGEPSHDPPDSSSLSPSHTVWYQWQAPATVSTTTTTAGSDFDTILAVYTGNTVGSLTRIGFNDDVQNGVIITSSVTFNAIAGTTYMIAVDGWGGDAGTVRLNWNGCPCTSPLVVNDNGDAGDASSGDGACATIGGVCTLRAAIQEANSRSFCGTIDINFSGVSSPIVLNSTLPDINHNININGPGPNQMTVMRSTANGTPNFRIFTLLANITVNISGVTLSNGNPSAGAGGNIANGSGGAIRNSGNLTLTNVAVSGNRVTLSSVGAGGGIFNGNNLTIINSTINGNSVTPAGAQGGGGIYSIVGVLKVINSTISGNSSSTGGGGIYNANGGVTLTNVTVSNNRCNSDDSGFESGGGLLLSGGSATLSNTIVAGNFQGSSGSISNDFSTDAIVSSSSFNVIGQFSSSGFSGTGLVNGVNNNQVGVINPGLGSLANNGGPTMTHALLSGSPAINAGSNALAVDQNGNALTTDQRGTGFNRIVNGTVDIGAFESQASAPTPTPTPTPTPSNPIDQSSFFVKQHYLDFLSRQPDQSGWDFWTSQITNCGSNAQCIEVQRINVSASFFLSIEFQQTGYLVERMYKAAYGNATGNSTFNGAHQLAVPMVRFSEFLTDTQRIGQGVIVLQPGWDTLLENNKQAYTNEFVQTSRFIGAFPTSMTPAEFVDKLNSNAGNVLSSTERTTAINLFGGAGNTTNTTARAQAVRQIAEDTDLYNAEFNRAFVLAEYFGYLRRNPNDAPESTLDYTGYEFWLTKLNQFNGNYINAEMVRAFLSSTEYRQRFGP